MSTTFNFDPERDQALKELEATKAMWRRHLGRYDIVVAERDTARDEKDAAETDARAAIANFEEANNRASPSPRSRLNVTLFSRDIV